MVKCFLYRSGLSNRDRVLTLDNRTGKNRKIIDISTSTLLSEYRKVLAGVHAFSGHSLGRPNKMFWKMVVKNSTFVKLGPEIKSSLDEIYFLYGRKHKKKKSGNMARKSIFYRSMQMTKSTQTSPCYHHVNII